MRFVLNGTVVGETVGQAFRDDLRAAGIGDGRHGFEFRLPDVARDAPQILTVRFADSGALLHGGERLIVQSALSRSELFGKALAGGIWMPDKIDVTPATVTVEGWAVGPAAVSRPFVITHNGAPLQTEICDRPDMTQRLELSGAQLGFRAVGPNGDPDAAMQEFAFADARTGRPFNRHHTMHVRSSGTPVPDPSQRKRVSSSEDLGSYAVVGSSAFTRLERVLDEYFGRRIGAGTTLDWGCGCARVFRYLPEDDLVRFTGIDIDRDNIAWCRAHYPTASFEVVEPRPPTSLPDGAFDLVFGISVFTHLTEENHLEWLAELHRITRPGAAVLVSTHGETAWMLPGYTLERYPEWRTHGYHVAGKNFDLDEAYADTSFYFNSFVTRKYIFENWSRWFRVVDVIDGAISNHQDLVVLERV
ncbi:MAG TPA: class I SAM-dependent methyltransferase [Candidatus Elarobacter sp.]